MKQLFKIDRIDLKLGVWMNWGATIMGVTKLNMSYDIFYKLKNLIYS